MFNTIICLKAQDTNQTIRCTWLAPNDLCVIVPLDFRRQLRKENAIFKKGRNSIKKVENCIDY